MDIVAWPKDWYRVMSSRFYLGSASQVSNSPWSGRKSVYGPHRQMWRCEIQLAPQKAHRWPAISAFFSEVAGQAKLIRIGDPQRPRPQYNMRETLSSQGFSDSTFFDDGTGFVEGGIPSLIHVAGAESRGATSVVVGGLPESLSRPLRRGDLFEIRRNGIADETPSLHEVIRDAPSDADGETRIEFRPPLRKGVDAGDMVVLERPTSVFRCIDDDQGIVDRSLGNVGVLGFTLLENII